MPKVFQTRDLRNGDWYWIHKQVYSRYAKKIGVIGLGLYNAYCNYANTETSTAYPSIQTLCKDLKISRQTIFKYNEILEKYKLIKVESGKGRKNVNVVYILKIKVNDVSEKVKLATEKVNVVDTEQELLTRITNKNSNGFKKLREKITELGFKKSIL